MSDLPNEMWKKCVSYPAYSVSTCGRIRRDALVHGGGGSIRVPSGVLTQRNLPRGHVQVTLSMHNHPVTVLVHRLVAEAFLPPPENGANCVCHRDDNPSNNVPENLFWGTRADNSRDMTEKGRQAKGRRIWGAKLSEDAIRAIREDIHVGLSQRLISLKHGVSQSSISFIATGKTWKHVK